MTELDPSIARTISQLRSTLDKCHQVDQSSLSYRAKVLQCGKDALALLAHDSGKAHELAEIKLRSLPKAQMASSQWSSLYAESTLQIVIGLITSAQTAVIEHLCLEIGVLKNTPNSQSTIPEDSRNMSVLSILDIVLSKVTTILDRAMLLTGMPSELLPWIHDILRELSFIAGDADTEFITLSPEPTSSRQITLEWTPNDRLLIPANLLPTFPAQSKDTHPPIKFPVEALSLSGEDDMNEFISYLGTSHFTRNDRQGPLPVVVLNGMQWTALNLWRDPAYLMKLTMGGRRMVPVEIGKSYTESEWTQKLMPFREFVVRYMLPEGILPARERGYLAQHDLFRQIPDLEKDISEPIFCYSEPPHPLFPEPKSTEIQEDEKDLSDEVQKNIWMGPAQTVSPAHTDPYHNIFVQVIGYKYVRLYPPSKRANMYPRGSENGINMSNTSRVDVAHAMRLYEGWTGWDEADEIGEYDVFMLRKELDEQFPLLRDAVYVETVLEPGQMLFLPKGWFHYIRSLSTSISVSFWWK